MKKRQAKATKHRGAFTYLSTAIATAAGRPSAFLLATGVIVVWAITGPMFDYSDTWQLLINTGTTIVTFLMVFLIQATQNRDTKALQIKLDELIRATQGAHTALLDLEELSETELCAFQKKYEDIAKVARKRMKDGKDDTDIPKVVLNQ